jgi:tetratricopeptide (TPR) repeat protein
MNRDLDSLLSTAEQSLEAGKLAEAASAARRAVKRAPQCPLAHTLLGRVRAAEGRLSDAVLCFAAAVRLSPRDAENWRELGIARCEAGDMHGGQAALRRCLAIAPGDDLATARLAASMRSSGDVEGADGMLRAALCDKSVWIRIELADNLLHDDKEEEAATLLSGELPADHLARAVWLSLQAHIAMWRGDRKAAQGLLDQIGDPPRGAALRIGWRRVLLEAAEGREESATSKARDIAQRLNESAESREDRVATHFGLARFWAARDARSDAFRHWTAGHQLMREIEPFHRAGFAEFVDATIGCFDRARLHSGPRADNADPAPVFIVGMPRSGTTLAEQILAGHHAIYGAGERTNLGLAFTRAGGARETAAAVARVAALGCSELDAMATNYLAEMHALAPGAARIVDKMPGNFRLLGFASLLFPSARFIHCVRDPRDIGFSIFSLRFFGYHPYAHDLGDLGFYIAQHHRLMEHWLQSLPIKPIRIHLHDWIRDLKGTLARVLAYLELPYDVRCEQFFELDREVRTASRDQVRRPINRLGLGRWRDYETELRPLIDELQTQGVLPRH